MLCPRQDYARSNPSETIALAIEVRIASVFLTMLSYLPIYFQSGLQQTPQAAGFLMLPMVISLFVVPRIVVAHLSHRVSSRSPIGFRTCGG